MKKQPYEIHNTDFWKHASPKQIELAYRFKDIFIEQRIDDIDTIFSSNFGVHNGYSQKQYVNYEMEEFLHKCERFGLRSDCSVSCYSLGYNYLYFSLGKKDDKALFEGLFMWDELEEKLKGNQYYFKIEPKIQFFLEKVQGNNHLLTTKRRINLTPPIANSMQENEIANTRIKNVVVEADIENFELIKSELPAHLGGNFYSVIYELYDEKCETFWDKIKIFSSEGVFTSYALMRGTDHPLFIPDLFTEVTEYSIRCKEDIYPVVLYVLFDDGEEKYYKYPEERYWQFDKKICKVCLTDSLSFDWIIEL